MTLAKSPEAFFCVAFLEKGFWQLSAIAWGI